MAAAIVAGVGVLPSLALATLSDLNSALTPSKALGVRCEAAMTATILCPSGPHPKAGSQTHKMTKTVRQNMSTTGTALAGPTPSHPPLLALGKSSTRDTSGLKAPTRRKWSWMVATSLSAAMHEPLSPRSVRPPSTRSPQSTLPKMGIGDYRRESFTCRNNPQGSRFCRVRRGFGYTGCTPRRKQGAEAAPCCHC